MRIPVKVSASGHRRLDQVFGMCAELYNANLESWKGTYQWWKERHNPEVEEFPSEWNLSLFDRIKMFTKVRSDLPEWERLSVQVGRGVLYRFDRTIQSFYKRCAEEGKKPGYPRFKPARRWKSIELPDPTPSMLQAPGTAKNQSVKWWRLSVKGIPRMRFRDKGHRLEKALGMGATVKELRVVRTPLRVELHVVLKHPDRELPEKPVTNPVGIGTGVADRLILSDGTHIPARKPDHRSIIRKQKTLSKADQAHREREKETGKKLPYSKTMRKKQKALAKAHRRDKESADQADFRLCHELVTTFDGIAIENSPYKAWTRSRRFGKKLHDQRLSSIPPKLGHKAAKAGIPLEMVDPAYTTTDCSQCGHRQKMPLKARVYECGNCGMVMCRDCNSAINKSARAFGRTPGSGGKPRCSRAIEDVGVRPASPPGESGGLTGCRTVPKNDSPTAVNYSL